MKFALVSDLHLDDSKVAPDQLNIPEGIDLVIIAGDLHPSSYTRQTFISDLNKRYGCEVMFIPGNHDYWHQTPARDPMAEMTVKGVKIAGATLWTKLNPQEWVAYMLGLNDYRYMRGWTEATYTAAHEAQKAFLFGSGADIIVSHHAPSWQSIHPQYHGDHLNCAYASDFDEEILAMKNPPIFWFHGHVHNNFDYMIGKTRVVCHPRGYRFESTNPLYEAMIFEV